MAQNDDLSPEEKTPVPDSDRSGTARRETIRPEAPRSGGDRPEPARRDAGVEAPAHRDAGRPPARVDDAPSDARFESARPPSVRPEPPRAEPQRFDSTRPDPNRGETDKKRLFERAIPELVKSFVERTVERGVGRLAEGPENFRQLVNDLKLPKEVLHYLYTQIDETKNGLYRVAAKEIRDVLEQTQFADEITKVLTKLSFEIKTEIRFIPNDAARSGERDRGEEGPESGTGLPKPEVTAHVSVKDRTKDVRRERRRREGT